MTHEDIQQALPLLDDHARAEFHKIKAGNWAVYSGDNIPEFYPSKKEAIAWQYAQHELPKDIRVKRLRSGCYELQLPDEDGSYRDYSQLFLERLDRENLLEFQEAFVTGYLPEWYFDPEDERYLEFFYKNMPIVQVGNVPDFEASALEGIGEGNGLLNAYVAHKDRPEYKLARLIIGKNGSLREYFGLCSVHLLAGMILLEETAPGSHPKVRTLRAVQSYLGRIIRNPASLSSTVDLAKSVRQTEGAFETLSPLHALSLNILGLVATGTAVAIPYIQVWGKELVPGMDPLDIPLVAFQFAEN